MKNKIVKTLILTIDYELFFGNRTGNVEKCMIEPTYELSKALDINNSKMTVFWDILHYYRLMELENRDAKLKEERKLIDEQISYLISNGNDIQLHLHPHWLDAQYLNGEWVFNYEHFNIHSLSEEENPNDIRTILGCLSISKQLIENEIKKYNPDYKVTTFRAGGYLIEPFVKLKKAFEYNNIYFDSSVLPRMNKTDSVNAYDFRNYPSDNFYNFEDSPATSIRDGRFTEFPVTTIRIPVYRNIIFSLIRYFKYSDLECGRLGTGSANKSNSDNKSFLSKVLTLLTEPKLTAFTTDGNFAERFNYMFNKIENNSSMILHPKLLNQHTLNILKDKLINNEIKFISINNFLNAG